MHILLLEDLASDARQWLASRHTVDYLPELADNPEALAARLGEVDALVVATTEAFRVPIIEAAAAARKPGNEVYSRSER